MQARIAQLEAEKAQDRRQIAELTDAVRTLASKVQPGQTISVPYIPAPAPVVVPFVPQRPWEWPYDVKITCGSGIVPCNTTGCAPGVETFGSIFVTNPANGLS